MAISMWSGTRARAAAAALGLRKGALNVVVGLTAIMAAWLRCVGLGLARARAYVAWLFRGTALLPGRSPGSLLWPLRAVVAGGASGRRRGAAGKAHTLWPPIVVAVSVCHSNHLVSCVTCLSYIKRCAARGDVRQKPHKRYERCHAERRLLWRRRFKDGQMGAQDKWRPQPFVPKTAPFVMRFCLRSSYRRCRGSKAVS